MSKRSWESRTGGAAVPGRVGKRAKEGKMHQRALRMCGLSVGSWRRPLVRSANYALAYDTQAQHESDMSPSVSPDLLIFIWLVHDS